jgi:metal-dependent amidase/aminoacylase/carboxypeptidase family protein
VHDDSTLPAGQIGFHPGFFRVSADAVDITVYGVDPIVIAAQVVLALQTIVSRENNPLVQVAGSMVTMPVFPALLALTRFEAEYLVQSS